MKHEIAGKMSTNLDPISCVMNDTKFNWLMPTEHWTTAQTQVWVNSWAVLNKVPFSIKIAIDTLFLNGFEYYLNSLDYMTEWLGIYGARLHQDYQHIVESFKSQDEPLENQLLLSEDDVFMGFDMCETDTDIDKLLNVTMTDITDEMIIQTIDELELITFDGCQIDMKMFDEISTQTEVTEISDNSLQTGRTEKPKLGRKPTFVPFLESLLKDSEFIDVIAWWDVETKTFQIRDYNKLSRAWLAMRPEVNSPNMRRSLTYQMKEAKTIRPINVLRELYQFI